LGERYRWLVKANWGWRYNFSIRAQPFLLLLLIGFCRIRNCNCLLENYDMTLLYPFTFYRKGIDVAPMIGLILNWKMSLWLR